MLAKEIKADSVVLHLRNADVPGTSYLVFCEGKRGRTVSDVKTWTIASVGFDMESHEVSFVERCGIAEVDWDGTGINALRTVLTLKSSF